jgi:ribosomal protein S18 acetylase RimI-like enzyme
MPVRELGTADLGRIGEIDRSERAGAFYVLEAGGLVRVERDLEIPSWTDAELAETVARLERALASGGVLLGVEDGERLVAAAVLGGRWLSGAAHRVELEFLHVSSTHRRRGLAGMLFDEVCRRARERGASELYVSSSDVEHAVRFYLARGCEPTDRPDPAVVARWPTDIQLTLAL